MSRAHDIIVYGATGFTGSLITRYIASKWADIPVDRWAIAGRDESKLKSLRQSLPRDDQKEKLRLMVIDASDRQQLKSMTSQTCVLINCVGPFVKYGEPVVEACVEAGTHYVDITGEPSFIKNIINKYHAQAQEKKILVIPASGFDSVPADIGVFFAEKRKAKKQLKQAEAYISTHGGGMSYGTYSTIIESLSNNAPKASRESVSESGQKRPPNIQRLIPHRSPNTNTWVFPFNFTSDPFVVTRSRRLLEEENFSFAEYLEMPNLISAILLAIVLFVFFLIIRIPGGKGASFLRSLRKEGSGPSEEVRKKATTSARFYVEDVDGSKSVARYAGPEGYEATALFATEAALTILRDVRFDSLPSSRTGVTTPAAALGEAYIDRLLSTGLVKFE